MRRRRKGNVDVVPNLTLARPPPRLGGELGESGIGWWRGPEVGSAGLPGIPGLLVDGPVEAAAPPLVVRPRLRAMMLGRRRVKVEAPKVSVEYPSVGVLPWARP